MGAMNIFVMTNAPEETVEKLRPLIQKSAAFKKWGLRLAYRKLDEGNYQSIPKSAGPFSLELLPAGSTPKPRPQPHGWTYELAVRFPVKRKDGDEYFARLMDLKPLFESALTDTSSAAFKENSWDGKAVELSAFTHDPVATFDVLKPVLEEHAPRQDFLVGYRDFKTFSWTPLWPKDLEVFPGRLSRN
jgi:hypothetical protein